MSNFKISYLPESLMSELVTLITNENWVETNDPEIRLVPRWSEIDYIPNADDIQSVSYDDESQIYWCPKKYMDWSKKLMLHFNQEFRELSFELWEGAEDTGWHVDDGSTYVNKIFMVYYTPQELHQCDGGVFEYKSDGRILSVIPSTGVCINFTCVDSWHRAIRMNSEKKRYSALVRCQTFEKRV